MGKLWIPGVGGGADLDPVTAGATDIRKGKVIVDKNGNPLTGTMAEIAAKTYTPGTANQVIAANQFLAGAQTIRGDGNLVAGNILNGVNIFGVTGNVKAIKSRSSTVTSSTSTRSISITAGWNPGSMYYADVPTNMNVSGIMWCDGAIVGAWWGNPGHCGGATSGGNAIRFDYKSDATWFINSSTARLPCTNGVATVWYCVLGY